MRLCALLHRTGYIDENNDAALAQPAPPVPQADDLAGMPHGIAKHAPRIRAGAAARGTPAVAATFRHARRQRTREKAQRFAFAAGSETAGGKPLGGCRLCARLAGLLAENRLGTDGRILGGFQRLLFARLALQAGYDRAEEVCIEQGVEFGETFRRRRERGARGAADIADLPRAK